MPEAYCDLQILPTQLLDLYRNEPESQRSLERKQDMTESNDQWPGAGTGDTGEKVARFGGAGDVERPSPLRVPAWKAASSACKPGRQRLGKP